MKLSYTLVRQGQPTIAREVVSSKDAVLTENMLVRDIQEGVTSELLVWVEDPHDVGLLSDCMPNLPWLWRGDEPMATCLTGEAAKTLLLNIARIIG